MASESSFDVVSKVERQEVDNALGQAAREIAQRFDFKGTDSSIGWAGEEHIDMESESEEKVKAIWDVFQSKLVKRGGCPSRRSRPMIRGSPGSGGRCRRPPRKASPRRTPRRSPSWCATRGPKGVKVQIQGDELRVSSKKRDDLQEVQRMIKDADYDFAVQFTNYR